MMFNLPVSIEQVLQEGVEYVDYLKKRFQLVHQYVRQNAQKGMQLQKTGYDQKENTRCVFIMYGSTPLLSQKESLPNFIDHGKDRIKYLKKG